MTRIGLLSDTHGDLPEQVFTHFTAVDEIWHAGDIGTMDVLRRLQAFKPMRAVYGNIDGQEIRTETSEVLSFSVEGLSVCMMHIGGYPPRYNPKSREVLDREKPHLFICGHSHILKVIPDSLRNLLHLNPGACGRQGWHKVNTMLRFDIDTDRVRNLEVVEWRR